MTALSIQPPFPLLTDIDGQPLEDGYIWIGTANLPAQTNPISVYWDAALTQPAAQPIRTQGGYPVNNGTPARLYVNSDYSIQVQNKNGSVLYSAPQATERYGALIISSADISFLQAGTGAVTRTAQSKMRDVVSVKDFGAVGDGVADDIAAINNAVTYLVSRGGGTLYFPEGTYMVTSPVLLRSNISYVGSGFATIIKSMPSNVGNVVGEYTTPSPQSQITICDMTIDGNSSNCAFPADDGDGNAIRLNQISFSVFRNVRIRNSVYNAVSVYNNSNDNFFEFLDIADVGKSGVLPAVYTFNGIFFEAGSSRNKVISPRINVTRQYGIWIGARDADNYDNEIICPWIASTASDGIRIGDEATSNVCYRPKIVSPTILSAGDVGIRTYHNGTGSVQEPEILGGLIKGCTNRGILMDAATFWGKVVGTRLDSNGAYNTTIVGADCSIYVESSGAITDEIQDAGTRTKIVSAIANGRQGTFVPTVLTGGAAVGRTYSNQQGNFRVNGNRVEFDISIVLSAKGSSTGNVTIGGLPFPSKSTGAFGSPNVQVAQVTYTGEPFGLVLNSSSSISIYTQSSGSTSTPLTDAGLGNSSEFYISGSYCI